MATYIEGLQQSGLIQNLRWADFLAIVTAKKLSLDYVTGTDTYTIVAQDGTMTYVCELVFASASASYPFPMPDGYTQAQNNTDVGTFISTYQTTANLVTHFVAGALGAAAPLSGASMAAVDTGGLLQSLNVVAPSTAAVATQRALVVALSPSTPIPTGANTIGAVNQGTSPWITSDQSDGSVAPGAAGTKSSLAGSVYNTVAPAPTTGQQVALQSDASGNLKVNLATPLPAGSNNIGSVTIASAVAISSYSASVRSLTVAAVPTDIFTITGSASKTITITRLTISGIQSGGGTALFRLIRRSTVDTGGTSTSITPIPSDTNNTAATATVASYTANPTLGTAVGDLQDLQIYIPGSLASQVSSPLEKVWGSAIGTQGIVLRGVTQQLAIHMNGVTMGGSSLNITVEWTEA